MYMALYHYQTQSHVTIKIKMQKLCHAQPLEHWRWDFIISFSLTWSKLILTELGIMLSVVTIFCNPVFFNTVAHRMVKLHSILALLQFNWASIRVSLSISNIQFLQCSKTDPP